MHIHRILGRATWPSVSALVLTPRKGASHFPARRFASTNIHISDQDAISRGYLEFPFPAPKYSPASGFVVLAYRDPVLFHI